MKILVFDFAARLDFSAPVTAQVFTLHCLPVQDAVQKQLQAAVMVDPPCRVARLTDGFGNPTLAGALQAPHSHFSYRSSGVVQVDASRTAPTGCDPVLRYPGALTTPDAALRSFAAALPVQDVTPRRWCELLNDAVYRHFVYRPGATHTGTPAAAALAGGAGVCQDYAQVFVAAARLHGLAARYCMGLSLGEGSTHAWAEVYLPQSGWLGFDPTRSSVVDEGYLRFATGRDAADCPPERGVLNGAAAQTQTVRMVLEEKQL